MGTSLYSVASHLTNSFICHVQSRLKCAWFGESIYFAWIRSKGIFYYGDQIFEDFFRHSLGGEDVKVCLLFMRMPFVFTFSIWFFRAAFHYWLIITDHRYLLSYPSWRLFREAPKQWHFKLICHVNLKSQIKCFKWFCSFTAGRYLVLRKGSQHKILIYTFLWRIEIIFPLLTWSFAADPDFNATGPIYGAEYLSSVSWRTGNCAGMLHLSEFTRNH